MSTNVLEVNENLPELIKANECIDTKVKTAVRLFDEFWREGELAMLFGASGTGKSLLAVQVADALSRGTPMHGFVMPRGRRKILYVDLSLSDAQFRERYGRHRFPQNLYRGRPRREVDLCGWIKATVETHDFKVVVVDDLSAVKRTHDGIRETLALMRGLKRLCSDLRISVLALSDALEPTDGWASERDLQRSRVLCTVADSVFCIGKTRRPENGARIFQTRSRAAHLYWNNSNAPIGEIKRLESGLLGFEFDERFEPHLDDATRRLIIRIYELRAKGETFRSIAANLGMSKSYAHELFQKWSPAIERGTISVDSCDLVVEEHDETTKIHEIHEQEEWDEAGFDEPVWLEEENENITKAPLLGKGGVADALGGRGGSLDPPFARENHPVSLAENASQPPLLRKEGSLEDHDMQARSINDLEIEYNSYHEPIYVESRDERTRKPMVWYQQFPEGTRRFQREPFSIQVQPLNAGPFL